ncbi:hypothetical protein PC115_g17760 [Phytophthora cactorum]|uniref:Uncharacterized protein n=1 Tax=Phytophthora cactorum TaxID=29920 RepID=A0A8T1B7Q5_9STRA|nr:hypothetical protein PC115_g17760 [Phytophthora cactorum]KAG3140016.1 hypothetical protein C6341_g20138 [Phytophthora cactorum]
MMQKMGTISFGRSIDSQKLLHVKREGKTMDDYETMDYWVPASSVCETTIDAVAKWELVNGQESVERFCLMQLAKAI